MPRVVVLAAVLLAGCTDVPAITSGVCGNHVLEAGEDCDQASFCSAACRIECDPAAATTCTGALDGTCCPDGFACGTDGVCRAPGGTLAAADVTEPFDAIDFTVADIDHDRIADVLGVSSGSVTARYGSSTAPLAASVVRDAPFANGLPALGDFTDDGQPDVIIPTTGGLFGFETSSGAPEPVAFPSELDPGVAHARIAALGGSDLLRVDVVMSAGNLSLAVSKTGSLAMPPCGAASAVPPGLLRGRQIHPWSDAGGTGPHLLLPMLFLGPDATHGTLCIHAFKSTGVVPFGGLVDYGATVATLPPDGETFYADLDENPTTCPDLLLPVIDTLGSEKTYVVAGTGSPGSCGLAMKPLMPGHVDANPLGDGLPLAVMHVLTASGKVLALVTSTGVYALDASGRNPTPIAAATRSWRYVAIGDFNGDGLDDIATGASSDDAEILLQIAGTPGVPASFRQLRIVTGGAVVQLATGDFDGDQIDDVALATVDFSNDRSGQLEVVYGGSQIGQEPPLAGPSFPEIDAFVVTSLLDPALPPGYDHSDDLIVAHGNDSLSGDAKLTQVYGSSTRALTAPCTLQSSFGDSAAGQVSGQGLVAAIGKYGTNGGPGVLALFTHRPDATVPLLFSWTQLAWTADDTLSPLTGDKSFDTGIDASAFTNLTVPGGELLLGFGTVGDGCFAGYYLAGSTPALTWTSEACTAMAPGVSSDVAKSLGQGTLVKAYPPFDSSSDGTLIVRDFSSMLLHTYQWTLHVTGGTPTLSDPIDYDQELQIDTGGCMDAAPIELGTAAGGFGDGPEWVVACRMPLAGGRFSTQVFAAATDSSGQRHYTRLFDTGADVLVTLRTGDLNGDGVQDIVYLAGPPGFGTVHLRIQCDSHGTCQGGS